VGGGRWRAVAVAIPAMAIEAEVDRLGRGQTKTRESTWDTEIHRFDFISSSMCS